MKSILNIFLVLFILCSCSSTNNVISQNPEPQIVIDSFIKPVLFSSNQYSLIDVKELNTLSNLLQKHDNLNLKIVGNATSKELKLNPELSKKRAITVSDYLIKNGIEKSRITINDVKDTQPRQADKLEKENQYVEIIIYE